MERRPELPDAWERIVVMLWRRERQNFADLEYNYQIQRSDQVVAAGKKELRNIGRRPLSLYLRGDVFWSS